MLWAGRLLCLPESAAEALPSDSRGDMGMAEEPSGGMVAVAISGKSEVRLKLGRCGAMAEGVFPMGKAGGGISGSSGGKLAWAKPTARGGDKMELKRLLSGGGALLLSAHGAELVNIWLEKYCRGMSLGREGWAAGE